MRKHFEITVFFILTALCLFAVHAYASFFTPASSDASVITITVPKGATLRDAALGLKNAGVIRDQRAVVLTARLLGAGRSVKAGEYEVSASMRPLAILDMLIKGKIKSYTVTVPEGYSLYDIAGALKDARLIAGEDEFVMRATDKRLTSALGLDGDSLEGYLFPDTYVFASGTPVDEIIAKMAEKFKTVYFREIDSEARRLGMSMKKVVTLASLIEKEAAASEERPLISAVFHNRLRKRIKLQSDPTAVYTIRDFSGSITRKHLLARTPYNTYVIYGLPPGPIASPGRASLLAALRPAKEDYLYFVSKNNGTHEFSRSLDEHNKAVKLYRRRKARPVSARG